MESTKTIHGLSSAKGIDPKLLSILVSLNNDFDVGGLLESGDAGNVVEK